MEDFIGALHLNFAPRHLVVKTLEQIHQLIDFKKCLTASPFSVSELRFILKGEETGTVRYKTSLETVGTIVREVQASQVWNEITPDTAVGIVREIQRPQITDKIVGLKDALARFFQLTSERMTAMLHMAGSDLNSVGIRTALNVTFTNGMPDRPADLNALRDLLNRIAQVVILEAMKGIVSEVQNPQVTDKIAGLKGALAKFFQLTSEQMIEMLRLAGSDLNSAGIWTALNAFTNGVLGNPAHLNALRDLLSEINQVLKIEALKASLTKSFNLAANQLDNTLQWVNGDINSAGIVTVLNATFIEVDTDTGPKVVPQTPTDVDALLAFMKKMERVLLIFGTLKFKDVTVAYLTAQPEAVGIANLKTLSLNNLQAIAFYKTLVSLKEEAEPKLQATLDNYLAMRGTFSSNDIALLAELRQQDASLIESLVRSLTLSPVPSEALEYLWEALDLCQILGVNGYSLQKLTGEAEYLPPFPFLTRNVTGIEELRSSAPRFVDETVARMPRVAQPLAKVIAARDVALGAFSSKYDDENVRREKLEPYQDQINVIKRDALCDYIIARQQDLKFKDHSDIYAFLLLDVEMSGCFRTSRVVCAISSLQLYVHRVLMNLEQSASGDLSVLNGIDASELAQFAQEWEWRKNYRVWEANRKVFLYAEHYVEPDLRDNKTHIFKELEDELLQEKITKESAEFAYRKYVTGLTELAKLRIVGSYYDGDMDMYYLFGRTHTNPYHYYYRTLMRKRNPLPQRIPTYGETGSRWN